MRQFPRTLLAQLLFSSLVLATVQACSSDDGSFQDNIGEQNEEQLDPLNGDTSPGDIVAEPDQGPALPGEAPEPEPEPSPAPPAEEPEPEPEPEPDSSPALPAE